MENANIIIISLVHIITMLEHRCLVLDEILLLSFYTYTIQVNKKLVIWFKIGSSGGSDGGSRKTNHKYKASHSFGNREF